MRYDRKLIQGAALVCIISASGLLPAAAEWSMADYSREVRHQIDQAQQLNALSFSDCNYFGSERAKLIAHQEAMRRLRGGRLNASDRRILLSEWQDLYRRVNERAGFPLPKIWH